MAYSPIEDKYLSALTAMQFPDEPVEVAMPEQVAPGTQPSDVLLAAGPSDTATDAGGGAVMKPTPRNPVMGGVADFVRGVRDLANQYEVKQFVPLLGGMGVGDLLMGKSPEELEEWAYGNAPMRVPEMTNVPMIKTGRKEQVMDTMFLGLDATGLAKGAGMVGKAAVKKLAPKAGEMIGDYMERSGLQMNLIAYHGTPHTINKFDASKIGTGEGAQAYGLGLYFSESPDVANSYRIALSYDPEKMKVGGKQINQVYKSIENKAASMPANKAQGEYEKLELLESLMMNNRLDDVQKSADQMLPTTKAWFEKSVKSEFETYGNLYTVEIPDGMISKMLDWDKPINKQDPLVRDIIAKAFPSGYINGKFVDPLNSRATGRAMLDQLDMIANKRNEPGFMSAETALRQAGVPGIRYLDEGSRDAGKGTRNIVVFPGGENEIKIIKSEGKK
jgi:hypothetical protein